MNKHLSSTCLVLSLSFFSACDQSPLSYDLIEKTLDQNQSKEVVVSQPTPAKPKNTLSKPTPKPIPQPTREKVAPPPQVKVEPKVSAPEEPTFSQELLTAVGNWSRIPKSVFPAKPVRSSANVELLAKTSSGQVIASSLSPAGSDLQVLGMKGTTLIVANANNSKLRGEIEIDQTDFKQLLAYRFELNKRKKAERAQRIESERAQAPKQKTSISKPDTPNKAKASDVTPDPLDFGHGRFCICKECREKRLALTGSLKTGHGLTP